MPSSFRVVLCPLFSHLISYHDPFPMLPVPCHPIPKHCHPAPQPRYSLGHKTITEWSGKWLCPFRGGNDLSNSPKYQFAIAARVLLSRAQVRGMEGLHSQAQQHLVHVSDISLWAQGMARHRNRGTGLPQWMVASGANSSHGLPWAPKLQREEVTLDKLPNCTWFPSGHPMAVSGLGLQWSNPQWGSAQ